MENECSFYFCVCIHGGVRNAWEVLCHVVNKMCVVITYNSPNDEGNGCYTYDNASDNPCGIGHSNYNLAFNGSNWNCICGSTARIDYSETCIHCH